MRGSRRVYRDAVDVRESLFQLRGERMGPVGDRVRTDLVVEPESLCQRPAVFERMEASGRHPGACRHLRRSPPFQPRRVGAAVKRWDGRADHVPAVRAAPHESSSAWSEQPLVAPTDEQIAAEPGDRLALDTESVNTVDRQQDRVACLAAALLDRRGYV